LTGWATEQELSVAQVVCEVGSGVSGKRPKAAANLVGP
jgi:putative resolvase